MLTTQTIFFFGVWVLGVKFYPTTTTELDGNGLEDAGKSI
jgi:hypothetical protein